MNKSIIAGADLILQSVQRTEQRIAWLRIGCEDYRPFHSRRDAQQLERRICDRLIGHLPASQQVLLKRGRSTA